MDIRELSFAEELNYNYISRKKCNHTEHDTVIDQEVVRISPNKFKIYEIRKCPIGHFYRSYKKSHII